MQRLDVTPSPPKAVGYPQLLCAKTATEGDCSSSKDRLERGQLLVVQLGDDLEDRDPVELDNSGLEVGGT